MSNELDEVARALFNGQLPLIWRKLAPDTLKSLGNWMSHFKKRYDQYSTWVNEAEPTVIWLSGKIFSKIHSYITDVIIKGLHIPESYLTALVQATCRKNGWPLDRSTLYTHVTQWQTAEEVVERPGQGLSMDQFVIVLSLACFLGCFVSGLYLEGGAWDIKKGCLIKSKPKQLVQELPVLKGLLSIFFTDNI